MSALTPGIRAALVAAHNSPGKCLVRRRRAWVGEGSTAPEFTFRLVKIMERAWLFELDDPVCPTKATLTTRGAADAAILAGAHKRAA